MYGLVNRAVEEMIAERHGPDIWARIKQMAGVETDVFISHQSYDDAVTYKLVGAASEVLKTPADEILRQFGEHWVLKTGQASYGSLMKAAGRTFGEFLKNLPHFHTRVMLIYPKLKPPSFKVTEQTADSLKLHYISEREGLAPFGFGLLSGLGKMFDTEVQAELVASRAAGDEHEIFLVRWKTPSPA